MIFNLHLVLGYVVWLICTGTYILTKLKAMNATDAQRMIAALHSFRFFGLVFILPGVVGPGLPPGFAPFAAYGDFITGILAWCALLAARKGFLFWIFVVAFNLAGAIDILGDYYHGVSLALPAVAGELGSTYAIVIIYLPLLMITHVLGFYLMLRKQSQGAGYIDREAIAR